MDDRLVEAVAACLCWAEWRTLADRTDDPWLYWQTLGPEARQRYYRDAGRVASLLRSDKLYALIPVSATTEMCDAAMNAGRGVRSAAGAQAILHDMIEAARAGLMWRSGERE